MTVECPYTLQWDSLSPKMPFPMGDMDPHLIHGSLSPPESSTQTASRLGQQFLQGSLLWQTDRRRYSVSMIPVYTIQPVVKPVVQRVEQLVVQPVSLLRLGNYVTVRHSLSALYRCHYHKQHMTKLTPSTKLHGYFLQCLKPSSPRLPYPLWFVRHRTSLLQNKAIRRWTSSAPQTVAMLWQQNDVNVLVVDWPASTWSWPWSQ